MDLTRALIGWYLVTRYRLNSIAGYNIKLILSQGWKNKQIITIQERFAGQMSQVDVEERLNSDLYVRSVHSISKPFACKNCLLRFDYW